MIQRRPLDGLRRRDAFLLGGASIGLSAVLGVTGLVQRKPSQQQTAQGLVLPMLRRSAPNVLIVKITLSEGNYSLVRRAVDEWVMPERGNFPVNVKPLNQLAAGLAALTFKADKTRNPALFDRLGVSDPRKGGSGALIQLVDSLGQMIASLIVGVRPSGTYVRFPDNNQSYQVSGQLPPLQDARFWLDLTIPEIDPARIVRVSVNPMNSAPYMLARAPDGEFGLLNQDPVRAISAKAATTGLAVTRWRPIDALPRGALKNARVEGFMDVVTIDGLAVRGTAKTTGPRYWIELDAANVSSTPSPEAGAINAKTSNWAFEFTRFDWKDWITPLSEITP
jgi:hypothetical protein